MKGGRGNRSKTLNVIEEQLRLSGDAAIPNGWHRGRVQREMAARLGRDVAQRGGKLTTRTDAVVGRQKNGGR